MTGDPTQALEAMLRDWERGNWEAGADLLSPDVHFSAAQPEGQVEACGPAQVATFMRDFLREWEEYRIALHDLEVVDRSRYLAVATQLGKGRESGLDVTAPAFIAIGMRQDRIQLLEWFLQRDDAVQRLTAFDPG